MKSALPLCQCFAQTFCGSIVGTVTDATGALIPGAKVTVTNRGAAETHSMDTASEGLSLLPGKYRDDVEKTGCKCFTREPITVEVRSAVRIDVAGVEAGAVTQTVKVKCETPFTAAGDVLARAGGRIAKGKRTAAQQPQPTGAGRARARRRAARHGRRRIAAISRRQFGRCEDAPSPRTVRRRDRGPSE